MFHEGEYLAQTKNLSLPQSFLEMTNESRECMTFSLGVNAVEMKILEVVIMAFKTCEVCASWRALICSIMCNVIVGII